MYTVATFVRSQHQIFHICFTFSKLKTFKIQAQQQFLSRYALEVNNK